MTSQALRASGFHYLLLIFYLTRKWGKKTQGNGRVSEHLGGMKIIEYLSALWKKMSILGLGRKLVPGVDYRGAGDAHTSLNLQWPGMLRKKEPGTGTKCIWKQVHCGI